MQHIPEQCPGIGADRAAQHCDIAGAPGLQVTIQSTDCIESAAERRELERIVDRRHAFGGVCGIAESKPFLQEDALVHYTSATEIAEFDAIKQVIQQNSSNGYTYLAAIHPPRHTMSAAELYEDLNTTDHEDVTLATFWPREFPSRQDFDETSRLYSFLRAASVTQSSERGLEFRL